MFDGPMIERFLRDEFGGGTFKSKAPVMEKIYEPLPPQMHRYDPSKGCENVVGSSYKVITLFWCYKNLGWTMTPPSLHVAELTKTECLINKLCLLYTSPSPRDRG